MRYRRQDFEFEAQYPARRCPCLRFDKRLAAHRKTRGQDGLLLLSCKTLSFSTTCRFIPAHGQTPIWLLIGQLREVRPVNIRRVTESTAADRRLVREVGIPYK